MIEVAVEVLDEQGGGHEVEHGHRHAADEQAGDFTGHQGNGEALEDGVRKNHGRAHHDGHGGEQHGAEADGSGIDDRLAQGHALPEAEFDEVHEDD